MYNVQLVCGRAWGCSFVDQICVKSRGLPGKLILPLKYWLLDRGGSPRSWLLFWEWHRADLAHLDFRTAYFRLPCALITVIFLPNSLSGSRGFFQLLFMPCPTDFLNCRIEKYNTTNKQRVGLQKVCLHIALRTQNTFP